MTRARSRSPWLMAGLPALAVLASHAHGAIARVGAPQSPAVASAPAATVPQTATAAPAGTASAPTALPGGLLPAAPAIVPGCLPGERGYFQASVRGALQAALDWRGAALDCQGGTRAAERGVRVSLQGTVPGSGERLRINIGMVAAPGASTSTAVPASVTVIVEGAQRIYATRDDTHCAVESLRQEALPAQFAARGAQAWRVAARGYCIDPLPALDAAGAAAGDRLYVDRFDFAAIAHFDPEPAHADAH